MSTGNLTPYGATMPWYGSLPRMGGYTNLVRWYNANWQPYCRWHLQMHFAYRNPDGNLIEIYSWESNWQWFRIGPGNGKALNRRQAVIWTNADRVTWRHMASSGNAYFTWCWSFASRSHLTGVATVQQRHHLPNTNALNDTSKHCYCK